MSSEDLDLRALGEVDRPIRPGIEAQAAIEAQMLAAFDDTLLQGEGVTVPDEVLDLSIKSDEGRLHRRRFGVIVSMVAALMLVLVSVVAVARQRSDSNIATRPPDRSIVVASVGELCRTDVVEFASAFGTYRDASNPFRNEGRDEALIRARADFIAAVELQASLWPDRYYRLVSNGLSEARFENEEARGLLGGPSPLVDPHHAASQEALVAIFASTGLPGAGACDTSGIEWRPGG